MVSCSHCDRTRKPERILRVLTLPLVFVRTVLVPGGPVLVGSPSVAASGANCGCGCALLMIAGPVEALYAWRLSTPATTLTGSWISRYGLVTTFMTLPPCKYRRSRPSDRPPEAKSYPPRLFHDFSTTFTRLFDYFWAVSLCEVVTGHYIFDELLGEVQTVTTLLQSLVFFKCHGSSTASDGLEFGISRRLGLRDLIMRRGPSRRCRTEISGVFGRNMGQVANPSRRAMLSLLLLLLSLLLPPRPVPATVVAIAAATASALVV